MPYVLTRCSSSSLIGNVSSTRTDYSEKTHNPVFEDSDPKYRIKGQTVRDLEPQTRSYIYPLQLTEYDVQQCRSNEQHKFKPHIGTSQYFEFALKDGYTAE